MIDTLSIARNSVTGFDQPQAEALAEQFAVRKEKAATKDFVRAEVNHQIDEFYFYLYAFYCNFLEIRASQDIHHLSFHRFQNADPFGM